MTFDLQAKGFSLNNARMCADLCRQVYGPAFDVGGSVAGNVFSIVDPKTDTHVMVEAAEAVIHVVARGSHSARNWETDFNALRDNTVIGGIHRGFWDAAESVFDDIVGVIAGLDAHLPIVVEGHSLGGSLALLLGYRLATKFPGRVNSVYAFEPAKVGNALFQKMFDAAIGAMTFCVTNAADLVPWLPEGFGYERVGNEIFFPSRGRAGDSAADASRGLTTAATTDWMVNPNAFTKLWSDKWEFLKEFTRLKASHWLGALNPCASPLLADHPIDVVIKRLNL